MGPVKKKTATYGAIGAVVLVVGIYWYRQHKAASTAATPPVDAIATQNASGDPFPPDGTVGDPTDPNSTDPNTGQTYGDEAAGNSAGIGFNPFPGGSNTDTTPSDTAPGPPFNSNAQWASFVESAMGSTGSDAIAAAIGHYLNGANLSPTEVTTAQEATAIGGNPPVPGPGNFPPSFRTAGGQHQNNAHNPVKGLKVTPRTTQADVSWSAEPHATKYLVKILGGGKVVQSDTVTGTKTTIHNLARGHHYTAQVRAQPGGAGGTDARANFTTK
jgi:hypothetical protein